VRIGVRVEDPLAMTGIIALTNSRGTDPLVYALVFCRYFLGFMLPSASIVVQSLLQYHYFDRANDLIDRIRNVIPRFLILSVLPTPFGVPLPYFSGLQIVAGKQAPQTSISDLTAAPSRPDASPAGQQKIAIFAELPLQGPQIAEH
jgi:hypothetical protein